MGDNNLEEAICLQRMFADLSEFERQQAKEDLEKLQGKTKDVIFKVHVTVKSLRKAADKLDKVWKDCKVAHACGTTAGIVGGLLTIGGGVATIMTMGIAAPVLLVGMGVGAAGAGTNLGTSIAEASINSTEIKKAEKDLKETLDCINDVKNTVQLWLDGKEEARLLYIFCLAMRTLELSDPVIKLLHQVIFHVTSIPAVFVEAATRIFMEVGRPYAKAAGQVGAKAAGQAGAKAARKVGTKVAGRIGAKAAGRIGAKAAGQPGAKAAGQAGVQVAGQTGVQVASKVSVEVTGQAAVKVTSQVSAQVTGQAGLQAAGQAGAQAAGQAGVQTAGQAGAQAAGRAGAQAAGDLVESSAKAGAKAGTKLAGGLIIGVSAFFLVVDAIDLGFTIRDLVEEKGSEAATSLREKADELEQLISKN